MKYYLAIDIGASSGRHIIGYMDNGELKLEEIYRFKNGPVSFNNHLIWDIDYLFDEVKEGIKIAIEKYKDIVSMSIDTWAVDYVLLENDKTIYPVYAYRDDRTDLSVKEVSKIMKYEDMYKITGCQFQKFNTVFQLYRDKMEGRLDKATDFLMIPEYLIYRLTGKKVKEITNASTTGIYDYNKKEYSDVIIDKLGLKKSLFKEVIGSYETVGYFTKEIEDEVKGNILVKLCATHDTGSAVEGIKLKDNSIYISSGTWSLLGVKRDELLISDESFKYNYSNELGPTYVRLQKNIMGLWITQNLKKELNKGFVELADMAEESTYNELFNVNDDRFFSPTNTKDSIIGYFKEKNMELPKNDKDIIRSTYRSLAYSYKEAIDELETITNNKYDYLYIVGGGAQNKFLNKCIMEFIKNKEIIILPIEATSIGNLHVQMESDNEKRS